MMVTSFESAAARKTFSEATVLWDSGKQLDAVEKYRSLTTVKSGRLGKTDTGLAYRRVIEFDAENGDQVEAKKLIGRANDLGIDLSLQSSQAKTLQVEQHSESSASRTDASSTTGKQNPRDGTDYYKLGYDEAYTLGKQSGNDLDGEIARYRSYPGQDGISRNY